MRNIVIVTTFHIRRATIFGVFGLRLIAVVFQRRGLQRILLSSLGPEPEQG